MKAINIQYKDIEKIYKFLKAKKPSYILCKRSLQIKIWDSLNLILVSSPYIHLVTTRSKLEDLLTSFPNNPITQ